jgi:hypothetical protein
MAAQFITMQPSKANRITVAIRFDTNRRMRSQAVVLLGDKDTEPSRMLSWRDDVGEPDQVSKTSQPAEPSCGSSRGHADLRRAIREFPLSRSCRRRDRRHQWVAAFILTFDNDLSNGRTEWIIETPY